MELNQIGNKIRELRIGHGLTQAELGKLVGVSMQAVSKWERGGTPDIEVLLSLAEYFGVTLDEMFGRTINDNCQLADMLYYALLHTPEKNRMEQACRYCWSIFKGVSGIPEMQNVDYSTASVANPENTRGRVFTNGGIGYALAAHDAHMVAIMPEPLEGYGAILAKAEIYTDLFRFLSDPDVFQLLVFICTRAQSLFSLGLASRSTGIPEEKVQAVFSEFSRREWLVKEQADVDSGTVTLYRATYKEYFAFFLHFANEMTISPRFWFLSSCTKRTEPLLRTETE